MAFDKEKLKEHLKRNSLTQGDLAKLVGKDVRTIRRWLSRKESIKPHTIDKICKALGVSQKQFDPDWTESCAQWDEAQVGARVSRAAANGYIIMKKKYGISKKQLIELAPIMFDVIAERALTRSKRIKHDQTQLELIAKMLNLRVSKPDYNQDFEARHEQEIRSRAEEAGKVFGFTDDFEYSSNPFMEEMAELSIGDQHDWFSANRYQEDLINSRGYHYSKQLIENFTDNDTDLIKSIAEGHIDISQMDGHLWEPENKAERIRWLKHQQNNNAMIVRKKEAVARNKLRKMNPELAEEVERLLSPSLNEKNDNVVSLTKNKRISK